MPFSNPPENWKKGLLPIRPGNYMAYLGPYREITGTEMVKKSVSAWNSTFIGGKGKSLGFGRLTLYW